MSETIIGTINYPIPLSALEGLAEWVSSAYDGEAFLKDVGHGVEIIVRNNLEGAQL